MHTADQGQRPATATSGRRPGGLLRCLVSVLLAQAAASHAQGIYRCEQEGRVVYTQTRCEQGHALDLRDARSAEQQQQALQNIRRDTALGQRLSQERRQREAAAAPAIGLSAQPLPPPPVSVLGGKAPSKKKPKAGKTNGDQVFTAEVPGSRRTASKKKVATPSP